MMCQEVIELMQRHLDRDLDETEYSRMLDHLHGCPECTELFERLVNLSSELERLPKINPSYSLVDAILPKLEQMDREVPISNSPYADMDEISERRSTRYKRKQKNGWFSIPIFGAVVAAGLVLGFFIFQQQQSKPMQDAGGLLSQIGMSKETKSSAAAQAGSTERSEISDTSAPKQMEQGGAAAKSAPNADTFIQQQTSNAAGTPAGSSAQQSGNQPDAKGAAATGATNPQAAVQGSSDGPRADVQRSGSITAPTQTPAPTTTPAAAVDPTPVPTPTSTPQAKQPSDEKAPATLLAPKASAGGTDQDQTPEASPKSMEKSQEGGRQPMGIAAMPRQSLTAAPPQLTSQDGAYTAVTQDGHVVIKDQQGAVVFTSKNNVTGNDEVTFVSWTTDYKLTYQLRLSEQSSKTFVIDVKAQTEDEK